MNILDSQEEIAKIDLGNVLGSVEALPDQCLDAWDKAQNISVPDSYKNIDNVIMCGMGGSGLGARVIESVYSEELKVPLIRVNGYNLPAFANDKSLISCSSYSGSTEETIQNANQAIAKNLKWMAIGTGGKLLELAQEHKVPFYKIDPKFNPSNQPRMAIGYSVIGQLALAAHAGIVSITKKEIEEISKVMAEVVDKTKVEVPENQNTAKQLAQAMKGKVVILVSNEHLTGPMHVVNNQQNENAKNVSFDLQIPELNHHLMEGLKHPESNSKDILFVFAFSKHYSDRVQKRFELTKQVVEKNGIKTFPLNSIRQLNYLKVLS